MTLALFASSGALIFMVIFLIALTEDAPIRRTPSVKSIPLPDLSRDESDDVTAEHHDRCKSHAA